MALPTTKRGSDMAEFLPNKEALFRCMEIATTPEAADYFEQQFKQKLTLTGMLEKSKAVLAKISEFVQNVHLQQENSANLWSGKMGPQTDFQNLQKNLAEKAAESLGSKLKGLITMDLAISELSQLIRGYTTEGKPLESKMVDMLDKLFNAWLAENKLISKGSALYEGTENGDIRKDAEGNDLKADAERVKQLIDDKAKGFQQFLQNKGIQANTQQHKYPEKTEAEKRQDVLHAEQKGIEPGKAADYEGTQPPSSSSTVR